MLSSGIDSSLITALMQVQSSQAIQTFTIGFHEDDFNEAEQAKAISSYLGTDHTELYVSPQQTLDFIPYLPQVYDEPFSDSSQLPTLLLSKLTRENVTVALTGDGGDELFGGYSRYQTASALRLLLSILPESTIQSISRRFSSSSSLKTSPLLHLFASTLSLPVSTVGDKLFKLTALVDRYGANNIYTGLMSTWDTSGELLMWDAETSHSIALGNDLPSNLSFVESLMFSDLHNYLPDNILVKLDRAAMAYSLETRLPFLDHRVIELSWRIPMRFKYRNGINKWVLRQVLNKYIPRELTERPKKGFSVPIESWLRGPLRDWAESLLDESRLLSDGLFNPHFVRQKWDEHLSGHRNWKNQL